MFEIVVVCTGNRNRSPIAEAALRRATEGLPVTVSSAGLLELGDAPVLPETLEAARRLGLDLSRHRARCLSTVDLTGADLVLGLELEHVAAAVVERGAPAERAFLLLELLMLLSDVEPEESDSLEKRARKMAASAHQQRRTRGAFNVGTAIPDPFGGPAAGFHDMAEGVDRACLLLADRLFGPR